MAANKDQRNLVEEVLRYAREHPELGQFSVAKSLLAQGMQISPSNVRNIWKRHNLETTYKRLLEKSKLAQRGSERSLSEAQQKLLSRKRIRRRLTAKGPEQTENASDISREQLLKSAATIFAKKGYDATSLKEICAAIGMQPASMYYHFKSKEALFSTVHRLGMRQVINALDKVASQYSDPVKRLEEMCATALRFQLDASELAIVVRVNTGIRFKPQLQKRIDADRAAYENRFRDVIETLPLDHDVDRTLLRLTLLGAINWTTFWYRPGRLTPEEIGRGISRVLLGPR